MAHLLPIFLKTNFSQLTPLLIFFCLVSNVFFFNIINKSGNSDLSLPRTKSTAEKILANPGDRCNTQGLAHRNYKRCSVKRHNTQDETAVSTSCQRWRVPKHGQDWVQ